LVAAEMQAQRRIAMATPELQTQVAAAVGLVMLLVDLLQLAAMAAPASSF